MSAPPEEQIASMFDGMAVVQLGRGDVVVFRTPAKLNKTQRDGALAVLEDAFGKDVPVLLLEGGQDLSIVRRPGLFARLWNRLHG